MKFICSDCRPDINFATSGRKVYSGKDCSECGKKTICIKVK